MTDINDIRSDVREKPRIYFSGGYWCVDTGLVTGWGRPSIWSMAWDFANRLNAPYADVPW